MRHLKYILLFLLLPFTGQGQGIINSYAYAVTGGGGGGYCGTGLDTASAYIAKIETYITPTTTQKNLVCSCYASLNSNSLTAEVKAAFIHKWANANANAVDMMNPNGIPATHNGSPTHGGPGITYNATTQSTDLNRNMQLASINSAGLFVKVETASTVTGMYIAGGNASTYSGIGNSGGQISGSITRNGTGVTVFGGTSSGFLHTVRTSSSNIVSYRNGVSVNTSGVGSLAPTTDDVFVGGRNQAGFIFQYVDATISLSGITTGAFNSTQAGTLNTIFTTLINGL